MILDFELWPVLSHFFLFFEDFRLRGVWALLEAGVGLRSDSLLPAEFTNWEGYELFDSSSSFPASPNGFFTEPDRSRLKLSVLLCSANGDSCFFLLLEKGS